MIIESTTLIIHEFNMPILQQKPTLKDVQEYVKQLELERSFAHQEILHKCLLLGEEIGELFKAVRKQQKLNIDQKSSIGTIGEELADILIYVCSIANRCNIDLEQALREKEEVNKTRTWYHPQNCVK